MCGKDVAHGTDKVRYGHRICRRVLAALDSAIPVRNLPGARGFHRVKPRDQMHVQVRRTLTKRDGVHAVTTGHLTDGAGNGA
jgi:hypothetical protein